MLKLYLRFRFVSKKMAKRLSDGFSVRIKWRAAVSSLSAVKKQLKDKRGKIKGEKALFRSFPFPFALFSLCSPANAGKRGAGQKMPTETKTQGGQEGNDPFRSAPGGEEKKNKLSLYDIE